ncbi:MAG TPA: tetratricopeptide repeat-containing sensor histidine kinase [Chryseolinea sp.]|nr:tetratricopeptide repeat-containing sensor histidine kinase [Chryseolinea sp.]
MKRLLIFLLLLSCVDSFAQKRGQALIDSLDAELPKLKEDSIKAKVLNRIAQTYEGINPLKCFPYAERGLQLSEKIQWKRGIANFNNNLGLYISDTGNSVLAKVYLEKSYAMNGELGNKMQQVNNLINIGRTYQFESDFSSANENLFKALTIAEEIKNNGQVAATAANLASSYFTQQNYPKATEYATLSLKYGTLANNTRQISKAYQQLGGVRHMLKDTAGSILYLRKAIRICEENHDEVGRADAMLNLALEYADHKKQIEIMLHVNAIMNEINPNSEISLANMGNLGNAYTQLAKETKSPDKEVYIKKAGEYLSRAKDLAEQNTSPEYQAHMYFMLSDLEEYKTNYKAALEYHKKATVTNDSLFSQEKKNQIAGLEGKRNIAVKDNEIAINQLKLADQRRTQLGLIAGLASLLIIGGLLYWQSRNRKKTNTTLMVLNNQLDEANKVKARFFGILSHDLRSPIVKLVHFLHLQKDNPDLLNEQQQTRHRQNISDSAENLLNTMEAMLLWSKERMENFRPNKKNIPVSDLFEYIKKFIGETEDVKISYQQTEGLQVSTDENYLRTIMQNLTSNAVRALRNTPGATIVWNAQKEGNKTILSITDNGPGIGTEQAKALFEDGIVSNEKSGFGLHLIRDLAKAIQYKIAVESEPGRGTTFTLSNVAA